MGYKVKAKPLVGPIAKPPTNTPLEQFENLFTSLVNQLHKLKGKY